MNDDPLKDDINFKFEKKIDRILEFLERNNIHFGNRDKDPRNLLKQLKFEENILEKNKIIDQLESILREFYKQNSNNE